MEICRPFKDPSGLPRWLSGKESAYQWRRCMFDPWVRKIPWRRKWQPTPVFLPGESHGQRSLPGYSPWGHKESDTTELTKQQGYLYLMKDLFLPPELSFNPAYAFILFCRNFSTPFCFDESVHSRVYATM